MIKLSIAIITYNEERNIERCLLSVKDIADEIIVVDSLSDDRTVAICKKYNATVISQKFLGHIEQKNLALSKTSYSYVLSLDADEALSDELKKSIISVKEKWKYDSYYFNRRTNYCGKWIKHSGWYPDAKVRLWRKEIAKWGGVNPHDKVVADINSSSKHLYGDLLHYSFYSVEEHMNQINKFSSIKAREMFKKGKRFSFCKMFISTLAKFFKHYIIKLGFLDGMDGFVISVNSAHSTFLSYFKLRQYIRDAKK
ncbi:MAG: glycosyltransferase family 2 protein [Bacteroidota bacterium]|nr:glycosyltransferase family 2 protein [Bacteroidota bacterium]